MAWLLPYRLRNRWHRPRAVLAVPAPAGLLVRWSPGLRPHLASDRPPPRLAAPSPRNAHDPPARPIVVSGMRPTGRLHLGHLHGALTNWVKLQEEHRLLLLLAPTGTRSPPTTSRPRRSRRPSGRCSSTSSPPASTRQRSTLFVQSQVKEHAELYLLLGMITPLGWLERSPLLQGGAGEPHRPRPGPLRLPRLPGADDRRHHPLQGDARAGGRRPGGAPRAVPRDRPQVQLPLRRGLPRAAAAAHRGRQGGRHRRPQDVEELRQRHRPGRAGRVDPQEDHGGGDRPAAQAAPGPGQPRRLRHLLPAQDLQRRRDHRLGRHQLPDRRHRLRRLQEEAAREARARPGEDARAARGAAGAPQGPRRAGAARQRQGARRWRR